MSETTKNNIMIALFLGYYLHEQIYVQGFSYYSNGERSGYAEKKDVYSKSEKLVYTKCDDAYGRDMPDVVNHFATPFLYAHEFDYHRSWTRLMEAVAAIEQIDLYNLDFVIGTHEINIAFQEKKFTTNVYQCNGKQEAVYVTVVAFLQWYTSSRIQKLQSLHDL
jgi:hypothetical protein